MKAHDMTWQLSGADLDLSRPRPSLVWSYLLGEKDHFSADRELADKILAALPSLAMMTRANRRFVFLAVWQVMSEMGIRQFIELGSGVPSKRGMNLHEIAQDIDPVARVLYIDNDPIVAAHSRALLAGNPAGRVEFLEADAADPGAILNHPVMTETLDLSRPVALMAVSTLMHFPDAVAHHIISTLLAGLPAGSCVVISHFTADFDPDRVFESIAVAQQGGITYIPRTRAQVMRFFTGLDLIEPGIVPLLGWRPGASATDGQDGHDPAESAEEDSRFPGMSATSVYYWVGIGRRRRLIPSTGNHMGQRHQEDGRSRQERPPA